MTPDYSPAHFARFVFRDKLNRRYLWTALSLTILLWVVFKLFYTHPNIIFDSYYYINAAVANADAGPWPVGYSKFIRCIGWFSHSAMVLLTVQYVLLNASLLLFFFTIRYFFRLGTATSHILFLFLLLNPIFVYTCNLILSDALFVTLSLLWLTQLFWLLFRPAWYMIVTHALLLLTLFTVRYYALYYPLVGALALLLCRQRPVFKAVGIALPALLIGGFIFYTSHTMEKQFGVKQFSPFGGWKLANDALYVYEHVYKEDTAPVPPRFQVLDQRVRQYFSQPHYAVSLSTNDATWGSFYMFIHPSPLIQHMFSIYGPDYSNLNFSKFAPMGPLYGAYGSYIIRRHPLAFAQHFVWPNVFRYLYPPQEVLVDYANPFSLRRDYLGQPAIQWFGLTTLRSPRSLILFRTQLFTVYPVLNTLIHLLFVLSGIAFLVLKAYRGLARPVVYALLVVAAFWLADLGFTLPTAGVVLRYQLFLMVVEFAFALFFIAFLLLQEKQQHPLAAR